MLKKWSQWAPIPIRIVLGLGLAYHGFPKLFSALGQASFISMLQSMGVPAPGLMVWVIGILEFGGGLLLFLGAFTEIVAAVIVVEIIINLGVALIRGGFPQPLPGQQPLPGVEVSLVYMAGLLAIMLTGAGVYSIDRMRSPSQAAEASKAQETM
jgi:putative oxidoreductase